MILLNASRVIQIMKVECLMSVKNGNLNLEDFDKDESEMKKVVQAAAAMKILQRYIFTNNEVKMVKH